MVVDTGDATSIASSKRAPDVERRVAPEDDFSHVVITALTDALNCEIHGITPPLHRTIDLDALDALFGRQYDGTARGDGRVAFVHGECKVVVEPDRVQVYHG